MEKCYPQEEERGYIGDGRYLLLLVRQDNVRANNMCASQFVRNICRYFPLLARQNNTRDNNMSASEFARNIWLMDENDEEIWRVHSDYDNAGLKFTGLNTSHSEYLAHRLADNRKEECMFSLNLESGRARPYPRDKNRYEGPKLELIKKWETRIYLNDEDYLLMDSGLPGTYARNVVRINGKGEEVWRIWPAKAESYDTFEFLYVRNGRCYVSCFDDRIHYLINLDSGEATYIERKEM